MRAIILGCFLFLGICTGHSSAFAGPKMQTVHISQASDSTDISARRKRHAKRHKVRHVRRAVQVASAPVSTSCNVDSGECSNSVAYSGGPRGGMRSVEPYKPPQWKSRYAVRKAPVPLASFGGGNLVAIARSQLGNGPIYGRRNLWCARFANYVLQRAGYRGTGSDLAADFARYGIRVSGPQVGALAVMHRGRRGGHVGIVSGVDGNGNPILVSGNFNNRVVEAPYPAGRIYAYVMPQS